MSLLFFLLITIAVAAGFLWATRKMVFEGNWDYFIFFLLGYLPIYITCLSLVYLVTRSPEAVLVFQSLKELIVLIAAFAFVIFQRKPFDYALRLQTTDWLMIFFLGLTVLFLVLPIGLASFTNKLLYFKGMIIPGLIYFLGRNSRMTEIDLTYVFQFLFVITIAAFLVNVFEGIILDTHLQQFTGYALFNLEISGLEPAGHYGLTWTFESTNAMKRFASFFANPLELASSVLMGFSAGLIWFLTSKRGMNWFYIFIMFCSIGSLIFASSRAAFAAFFIMIIFIAIVFRLFKLIGFGIFFFLLFTAYVLFFASDDLLFYVIDTLKMQDTSSVGHVVEWALAFDSMLSNPLGIGLAMSGNFGSVTDELRVGGENQFLIYGVQLGWLGMLLYISMLISGIRESIIVFKTSDNLNIARIAFVAGTVKVGLLLPMFTANVEIYAFVSWISWWMIGLSVREYSRIKLETNRNGLKI
ncbi:O-antigen ligase like membrane protein [Algoriphagus locisalis]|uniref:O-antigen ligase like membrane protein n=1 Tax=Algoriphagus locisalis TaxID=305507 RepID=A0A1I7ASI8_9BACT|nr:O-antigen ligase family protein [Algoriphagus locisalis]SFT77857.1 O-antigen ligase like membrane protein [Algoriphagus locisalis]